MRFTTRMRRCVAGLAGVAACAVCGVGVGWASDHGDTPLLIGAGRHDARITDLYAFTRGDNLVLALCVNPAIPPGVSEYRFPSDVEYRIMIDSHSQVAFDDPEDLATYGGTVVAPYLVGEDAEIRIRFNPQGKAQIQFTSMPMSPKAGDLSVFVGLRDDPFIRGPRTGRNVAAIVLEFPLSRVLDDQSTLLIWATSTVQRFDGPFQDLAGRSLRSMFPENDAMNTLEPHLHAPLFDGAPDVIILDTSRPSGYPNGRVLTDDVVDLVGDPRVLADDAPFPTENDVPFLDVFPYLAPPH